MVVNIIIISDLLQNNCRTIKVNNILKYITTNQILRIQIKYII